MSFLTFGFFTGLSLILAIGAQNIFVIEQGLKKQFVFIVCLICAVSDFLLIFLGIFLFHYFNNFFTPLIVLILNILLLLFLINFIWVKIKISYKEVKLDKTKDKKHLFNTVYKTLGFTYLNPHVYSDTVFILGNISKNFLLQEKIYFALGASSVSVLFFYCLGYLSGLSAKFFEGKNTWKYINIFIICFMTALIFYIIYSSYRNLLLL